MFISISPPHYNGFALTDFFYKKRPPTALRHRENIGRIGSLRVFWQISVIVVFPLKTGDLMFVGFDSQNTFTKFSISD